FIGSLAEEVGQRSHEGVRSRDLAFCLSSSALVLLRRGDRTGAEARWRQVAQLAEQTRDASLKIQAQAGPIYLAFVDGRLEEALALQKSRRDGARELGFGDFGLQKPPTLLGRAQEFLPDFGAPA